MLQEILNIVTFGRFFRFVTPDSEPVWDFTDADCLELPDAPFTVEDTSSKPDVAVWQHLPFLPDIVTLHYVTLQDGEGNTFQDVYALINEDLVFDWYFNQSYYKNLFMGVYQDVPREVAIRHLLLSPVLSKES